MFKKLFILNYSQNQCWSPDFWDQPKLILAAWLDKYIELPYYVIKSARSIMAVAAVLAKVNV